MTIVGNRGFSFDSAPTLIGKTGTADVQGRAKDGGSEKDRKERPINFLLINRFTSNQLEF